MSALAWFCGIVLLVGCSSGSPTAVDDSWNGRYRLVARNGAAAPWFYDISAPGWTCRFRADSGILELGLAAPGVVFTEYGQAVSGTDACLTKTVVWQYGTFATRGDSIAFVGLASAFRFTAGARNGMSLTTTTPNSGTTAAYSFVKE